MATVVCTKAVNGRESVAQYILRNPFSVEKMTYTDESGTVIYRSKMTHGKNKKNFNAYTAEEFIAAITQHISEKSFQMVRYYGWHSNKSRGLRLKRGIVRPGDEPLEHVGIDPYRDADVEIIADTVKDMARMYQEDMGGGSPGVSEVRQK